VRDDALGAAEAMYDPGLVRPAEVPSDARELAEAVVAHVGERFGVAPLYARVDVARTAGGSPVLMEVELVEPCLYLADVPTAAAALADAVMRSMASVR
jgi:hypothetical protein